MRTLLVLVIVGIIAAIGIGVSRGRKEASPSPSSAAPSTLAPAATSTPTRATAPSKTPKPESSGLATPPSNETPTTTQASPSPAPPPTTSPFAAFTIDADDAGFYPSSVTVSRDVIVSITFRVRADGVHDGGLDIRSSYFEVFSIAAGSVKTITFRTPARPETIVMSSFAQGTGYKKADGTIVVE